jgi:superkiller protein 3
MGAAILILSLLAAQQDNPMTQAMAHLEAGRHQQAITILKDLLEKNPDNYGVHFNLAVAQSMAGDDAEAIAGFRKALELEPKLYEAQLNLGQLLIKTRRFDEAAKVLQEAAGQRPKEFRPAFLLAGALLSAGKAEEAESRFRSACAIDPKQGDAWLGLGRALASQNKWQEAAEALKKAAEITPGDTALQLELANSFEKAKMPVEAAEIYARFPEDPEVQERLGLILLDRGDAAGAAAALQRAADKSPAPALQFALATAYLRAKQPEKSIPLAASIVERDPNNVEMRMFYGRLLRDQKRYAEAAKQFSIAAQARPNSLEAWNELTAMLMLLGNYDTALQTLEKAKSLGGETPAYHYFRATMLDAMKQAKPALESYERFLAASKGRSPEEEFKARQRVRVLRKVLER